MIFLAIPTRRANRAATESQEGDGEFCTRSRMADLMSAITHATLSTRLRRIRPGDVLGFSSCDATGSLIRACTGGLCGRGLSHVGVVTWWPNRSHYLLAESTTLADTPCVVLRERVSGVQVHWIRSRVLGYAGRVWHYPVARELAPDQVTALRRFTAKHLGVPYDYFGAARARHTPAAWIARRVFGEDLTAEFCSEFVAAAHRAIGLLQTDNASAFSPARLVRTERRAGVLAKGVRIK